MLARKPGKLPHETVRAEYVLEYGTDALELHSDAVAAGARVLVHDDLLATGGTAKALCELVEQLDGQVVACGFLIELAFLNGRENLAGYDVRSLLRYDASRCPPHAAAARSPRRLSAFGRSWAIRTTCRAGGRRSRAWRPSPTSTSPRS